MMNRRTFFRNILFGSASLLAAPTLLANVGTTPARPTPAPRNTDVSLLLDRIKKDMEEACNYFVFEPNDEITRQRLTNTLNGAFGHYKAKNDIKDFKVVCDETNNTPDNLKKNKLNVDFYIQPKYVPEYIILNASLTSNDSIV